MLDDLQDTVYALKEHWSRRNLSIIVGQLWLSKLNSGAKIENAITEFNSQLGTRVKEWERLATDGQVFHVRVVKL